MEGAHPGPPTQILHATVPSPTAESRSSNVEAVFSQTGQVLCGLELLTTSAGNEARVAPFLASGDRHYRPDLYVNDFCRV